MATVDTAGVSPDTTQARRAAGSAMLAASIEWYDFFIYGTAAALVFSSSFFPAFSPVAGVLAAFSTAAVGFLARPLGGVLCGHFGDRFGRKPVLVAALVTMGVATTLVGLLPTYETIGVAAPVVLVLLRLAQGLAVGGQWGGAMLLATEYAPPGRRGLYGSFVQLGVPVGLITGNLVFLGLSEVLAPGQFASWGWRVPFLFSVALVFVAMFIHRRLEETPAFRAVEQKLTAAQGRRRSPVIEALRRYPKQILLAAGAFLVVNSTFYVLVTGMLDYGTRELGLSHGTMLAAVLIGNALQLVAVPAFAALSDRVGRRGVFAAGAVLLALWAFPMWQLVDTASFPLIVLANAVAATCLSVMYGPQAALFAEMFSAEVRYSGASLGYQIASVVGGLAPVIMVLLVDRTHTSASIAAYVVLLALLALASLAGIRTVGATSDRETREPVGSR
jgi:MFS family permease